MNRFLAIMALFTVASCATPGPEQAQSESDRAVGQAQASRSVEAAEPLQADDANGDDMIARNDEDGGAKGIEAIEAPQVETTPASKFPGRPTGDPAIVCERVVPTGSVLPVKVCRTRSDIESKEKQDQRVFDDIKRNTANGVSRL